MEDVDHDVVKFLINLFSCPGKSHGVLAHLQCGCGNTASVCGFTRHEENTVLLKVCCCIKSSRHVSTLNDIFAAVCNQCFSSVKTKLVLSSTWKIDITFDVPDAKSLCVSSTLNTVSVLFDTSTFNFFDVFYNVKVDSVRIVDISVGVVHCNNFGTKLSSFLNSVNSYVTGTCYNDSFSFYGIIVCFCDLVEHVYNTVTGSLCTDQGTAEGETFTCENTLIETADSLVLSEEISDLTSADTDITSRNICICADIFAKLCHKALAECHNLSVRFALRIEVGATFSTTDRKACQRVFEDLLKAKKFQDTLVYGRMES